MRDLQKAKFKDHDTLVRWCAEADNEIQHFRRLVNKRNATIKELSKEVHDLETRVAELKEAIAESCEDDRQQILERGWGGCMEAHKLQDRVTELEGYLDQLLNQCAGDHMTACDKTMGASHPCTCGATEIRKHYRRLRHE